MILQDLTSVPSLVNRVSVSLTQKTRISIQRRVKRMVSLNYNSQLYAYSGAQLEDGGKAAKFTSYALEER